MKHDVARQRVSLRTMYGAALVLLLAGTARADVDMTGIWNVALIDTTGQFQFVQTGATLQVTQPLGFTGTIDPVTGQFSIDSTPETAAELRVCGRIDATVTADGNQFSGVFRYASLDCTPPNPECTCGTFDDGTPFSGGRCPTCSICGNGIVESSEQCDDGNTAAGDCCSSSCQLDGLFAPCTADAEACTFDACDGAGQCRHGPFPLCRAASERGAIALRADAAGGRLRWIWRDASATTVSSDFGQPTDATAARVCLFAGATLLFSGDAPPGASAVGRWRATPQGFTFKSSTAAAQGLTALRLRTVGPKTKLVTKGSGPSVAFNASLAVPAVRAQLVLQDAGRRCWEATFDQPTLTTPTAFTARQ